MKIINLNLKKWIFKSIIWKKANGDILAGFNRWHGHISKKCITISFHKRDIKAAQEIQNYLGHGILRTIAGKNALSYDLYNLRQYFISNLIRHKLRNHNRIVQFTHV
jgi:hypothetical protein